jgi:hypothetical protein
MAAASDLMGAGLSVDDDEKEFLTNMAQMKGGKMVIEVPESLQKQLGGSTVELATMTEAQKNILIEQREAFKKMSAEEIAQKQVSAVENINRDVAFIAAKARIEAGKTGDSLVKDLGFDPYKAAVESRELADKIAKGTEDTANTIRSVVTDVFGKDKEKQKGTVTTETKSVDNKQKENKEEKKPAATTTPAVEKKEVELKITSNGTLTDGIMRDMFKDAYFTDQVKGSYLNTL